MALMGWCSRWCTVPGGASSQQGLTIWGEAAFAPKARVNPLPSFVGGGMSY